jgi:hypothetical protein
MRSKLVLLLAACSGGGGGGGSHTDDAPAPPIVDASSDAPPDADESGRVDVTAYTFDLDGLPDPAAIVIFRDPSDHVVQHGPVDAQGHAHANLPQGGSVTVLQPKTDPQNVFYRYERITTIRAVEPGDQLFSGRTKTTIARTGAYDTMYASYTSINAAAGPYFLTACASPDGSGPPPYPRPFYFWASCKQPTFDLLALADDANTNTRKFVWLDDVQLVPGGSFTIPNTWQAMSTHTTTFLNTPPNVSVGARLSTVIDGVAYELDSKSVTAPPATSSLSLLYAPISAPLVINAGLGQSFYTLARYVIVTSGSPATTTVDWATLPVPRATNVTQNSEAVMWSLAAPVGGDARVVTWAAQWTDGNNVTHTAYEEVLEPVSGGNSSSMPTLPTAYADDDPMVHITTLRGASVTYFDYDHLADYHAVKPHGVEAFVVENRFLTTPHRVHVTIGATN